MGFWPTLIGLVDRVNLTFHKSNEVLTIKLRGPVTFFNHDLIGVLIVIYIAAWCQFVCLLRFLHLFAFAFVCYFFQVSWPWAVAVSFSLCLFFFFSHVLTVFSVVSCLPFLEFFFV